MNQLDNPALPADERTLGRSSAAAELTEAGQYEAAAEALGELWQGVGQRPEVARLAPDVAAHVLLRCGVLTGWLGSVRSVAGSQEMAKDLLSEALRGFRSQGMEAEASEAQYELGICYWRLGAFDEARVVMREALKPLTDSDVELKAKILIRSTLPEVSENRYHEALSILKEAAPIVESASDATKGRWHGQKGLVLRRLANAEGQPEYFDRAIIEYTAAIYHYEQAKHERYCALNLNNLAFLHYKLGRYPDAHEHLERARAIFTSLRDAGNLAQVDETRARVLVAEGRYAEANGVIADAIETLEQGGEAALLADALTVQGVVWARLGGYDSSVNILNHAVRVAEESGALTNAGLAALTLIEEHGPRVPESDLFRLYLRADELLAHTQDAEDVARLRACANLVIRRLTADEPQPLKVSLNDAVYELESKFIEQALEESLGSVSRAAKLLGMRHQSLTYLLNTRHRRLLRKRTPAKKRLKSVLAGD